jgi:hypothetical protein
VEERKLFCGQDDEDETTEEEVECAEEGDPSASELGDEFNFICLKNPATGFYCQAKAAELETTGAFQGTPTEEFPDPCAINCSSPTGVAISQMGCCMGSLLVISERYGIFTHAEEITARAATYKCGGIVAMTACNGENAGNLVPTETVIGEYPVDSCPSTKAESDLKAEDIARGLQMSSRNVNLIACQRGGTDCLGQGGRRLSGNKLEYQVLVTGSSSQIASKKNCCGDGSNQPCC